MIRNAQIKDIDRIYDLLHMVNDLHEELFPHLFKKGKTKYNADQLRDIIQSNEKIIFVYTNEDDLALAYIICEDVPIQDSENLKTIKTLYVDDICVDPAYQQKGIATSLYKHARKYAQENDYQRLTANVWEDNQASQKLFKSLKFQPVKTTYEDVL